MKLSIITVVYNGADTIEQTIRSVISQEYENVEYIVIDGASTDNTMEIVNKYRDKIAHIISEPDNGIYAAMNKGIKLATGEIVGIINSDDWYEADVFEMVNRAFQTENADIVYGDLRLVYRDGSIAMYSKSGLEKMCFEMSVPHPTVFVKKKIYDMYGAFSLNYKIASDYDLMLRLYLEGVKFYKINTVLANFRMTGISSMNADLCRTETQFIVDKYLDLNILREALENLGITKASTNLIYGVGFWGKWLIDKMQRLDISDIVCVDRDEEKQGTDILGITVNNKDCLKYFIGIVIVAIYDADEIVEQLEEEKFCHYRVLSQKQIMESYNEVTKIRKRL